MPERDLMPVGHPHPCCHGNAIGCRTSAISLASAFVCLVFAAMQVCAQIEPAPKHAASILQSNDVIAFVGGEDVVAMQQHGYLEVMLAVEIASKNIRFRNLGWEGDTVFEQRRELNFPSWEQTLAKIGATVIIAQFGQAESLRGRDAIPQFRQAAVDLLARLGSTNHHVIVLAPTPFEKPPGSLPDLTAHNDDLRLYSDELRKLCRINQWIFLDWAGTSSTTGRTRDGLHLNSRGHWSLAARVASLLHKGKNRAGFTFTPATGRFANPAAEELRQVVIARNKLWFDYWRPQNWAFLAGDRTEQPSSRDHRNPKIRWFPNELEQFLPLLEAKEQEVKTLAEKLMPPPAK